ncbi:MAG TPA: VanZ family protein [Bacillota bacterium]|nr:VanZ family protein [Bacillota bacterium]HPQ61743.1 VanZ family protein [Bacillota bacterium]HRX91270.1 VanZ family protein [Candidatus Izemoplasmatales bacterium]
MKKLWFILAILWTAVIFSFSRATGDESSSLSLWITERAKPIWDYLFSMHPIDLDTLHMIIRKAAHVFEFLVCGVFWSLAMPGRGYKIVILLSIGLCISLFDELGQIFVEGRSASLVDALVFDLPGFIVGIQAGIWKKQTK